MQFTGFHLTDQRGQCIEHHLHLTAEQISLRGLRAAVGYVYDVDAGKRVEQFARQMAQVSCPGRCHVELARIALCICDELGDCLGRNRRIDHHYNRDLVEARDGCDVIEKIEIEFLIECCIDCVSCCEEQERVAVRWCAHDAFRGDIGTCTWPVLDNKLLAEMFGQPLSDQTCANIGCSACTETDNDAD